MAAGDDVTDEDLFAQLPESAWSIHVGRNESRAKYYLPGPDEMLALLAQLLIPDDTPDLKSPRLPTNGDHALTANLTERIGISTHSLK
jgi:hypothetical protein